MHACCVVLCCAVLFIFIFHLSLPCECVCIYYLHVTAEGRYIGGYMYLTLYTVIPILYCLFCSKRGKLVLFR